MLGYYYLSISPVGTPDIENEMKIPAAATAIAVVDKTKREANVNMKEATTATNKTNLKTNKVCRKIDQQKKQMKKAKKKTIFVDRRRYDLRNDDNIVRNHETM